MTLKTVIENTKAEINCKLQNEKLTNSWTAPWEEIPTYFDFQNQVIALLDLCIKSNNFTELDKLTDDEVSLTKEKVLTLLSLSLNFSDLMNSTSGCLAIFGSTFLKSSFLQL